MSQLLKENETAAGTSAVADDVLANFKPRTELGRQLATMRRAIIESGLPLLDDDELAREIAERRGGVQEAESK